MYLQHKVNKKYNVNNVKIIMRSSVVVDVRGFVRFGILLVELDISVCVDGRGCIWGVGDVGRCWRCLLGKIFKRLLLNVKVVTISSAIKSATVVGNAFTNQLQTNPQYTSAQPQPAHNQAQANRIPSPITATPMVSSHRPLKMNKLMSS